MPGSGKEALSEVREWSGSPHECQSGREALPDVWKACPDVREFSGVDPVCSVVVGRTSRMSGSGREPFQMYRIGPEVWEWSGGPPGLPGVVERPPRCP